MANKKYDWEQVWRYFMAGHETGVTLKDVSEKFSIPYQTVRRYAGANDRHSTRYQTWLEEKHGMKF